MVLVQFYLLLEGQTVIYTHIFATTGTEDVQNGGLRVPDRVHAIRGGGGGDAIVTRGGGDPDLPPPLHPLQVPLVDSLL